jgi:hypothetical protein
MSCENMPSEIPEAKIHPLEPETGITRRPERLESSRGYSPELCSQHFIQPRPSRRRPGLRAACCRSKPAACCGEASVCHPVHLTVTHRPPSTISHQSSHPTLHSTSSSQRDGS